MTNREKIITASIVLLFIVMNYIRIDSVPNMLKKEKELSFKAIQAFKEKKDINTYLNQISYLNRQIKEKYNDRDIQTMTLFINLRIKDIQNSENVNLDTMYRLYSEIEEEEKYLLENLSI